jgi:hypothetical protein
LGTAFGNNTVKFIEVCVKVENYAAAHQKTGVLIQSGELTIDSNPLHYIDILRQHDDRFEITLHEGSFDKRTA